MTTTSYAPGDTVRTLTGTTVYIVESVDLIGYVTVRRPDTNTRTTFRWSRVCLVAGA